MEKTYSQLQQENELLRRLACLLMQTETIPALAAEVAALSTPEPTPEPEFGLSPEELAVRLRVRPEAYEYRLYELEMAYMMQEPDTPESKAAWESCERVRANYLRDYPDRPLNPKPRPDAKPAPDLRNARPAKKPRKPYTKRNAA